VIKNNIKAFTLVEVLVSLAILTVLLFFIASFFNISNEKNIDETRKYHVESEMREFFSQIKKNISLATSLDLSGTATTPGVNIQSFPEIIITQANPSGQVETTLTSECADAPSDVAILYQTVQKDFFCIQCTKAGQVPRVVLRDSSNKVLASFPINANDPRRAYSGELCFNQRTGVGNDKTIGILFRAGSRRKDSNGDISEEIIQIEGGAVIPHSGAATRILRKF